MLRNKSTKSFVVRIGIAIGALLVLATPNTALAFGTQSGTTCASEISGVTSTTVTGLSTPYGLSGSAGSYTVPQTFAKASSVGCTSSATVLKGTAEDWFLKFTSNPSALFQNNADRTISMTMTGDPGAGGWQVLALDTGATSSSGILIPITGASGVTQAWSTPSTSSTKTYEWTLNDTQYQNALLGKFVVKLAILGGTTGYGTGDTIQYSFETFTAATSTVIFDSNNGSGSMANDVNSVAAALSANAFTRAGYDFTGWNTAANGSGTAYADSASYDFSAGGTTLYAQWQLAQRTVTFDVNGGSGSMSSQSATTTQSLTSNTLTKSGYTFAGWATSQVLANAGTVAYADAASYDFINDGTRTLYAVWTAVPAAPSSPSTPSTPSSSPNTANGSTSSNLAYTGMNRTLYFAAGSFASALIILGGVMIIARRMQSNQNS